LLIFLPFCLENPISSLRAQVIVWPL
jgi:hypothetical protein